MESILHTIVKSRWRKEEKTNVQKVYAVKKEHRNCATKNERRERSRRK